MTEDYEKVIELLTVAVEDDEVVEEVIEEVPPPEPALDAAKAYRDRLVHRPMRLDPEKGAVPDLSVEEWEWLRAYRRAERGR